MVGTKIQIDPDWFPDRFGYVSLLIKLKYFPDQTGNLSRSDGWTEIQIYFDWFPERSGYSSGASALFFTVQLSLIEVWLGYLTGGKHGKNILYVCPRKYNLY